MSQPVSPSITNVTFNAITTKKILVQAGNGKTYEIVQLRQRVGGKTGQWQEVDLAKLSDQEKDAFIQAATKAATAFDRLDEAPEELKTAHTLTLQFKQQSESKPGLINSTLGRIFSRFAWKPEPKILEKITYKTTETSEEKTFDVHLDQYDPEAQQEFLNLTYGFTFMMRQLAEKHLSKSQGRKLKAQKTTQVPAAQPLPSTQQPPTDPNDNSQVSTQPPVAFDSTKMEQTEGPTIEELD